MFFFFLNDTATTEIYTLSLHDALPISPRRSALARVVGERVGRALHFRLAHRQPGGLRPLQHEGAIDQRVEHRPGLLGRSEEHTSELQSQSNLVCRLLLEKKKKKTRHDT